MLQLKDDNGNLLPQDVQDRVNNFIDNLQNVSWFKPKPDLKKSDVEKQINFMLECFWVEADIEFKTLNKEITFTWMSAMSSALASAMAAIMASNRNFTIRSNNSNPTIDSTIYSQWALSEVLIEDHKYFKKKYPNWAFKQLFKLWEMGLYPVWILKDTGKFTVYVPDIDLDTWGDTKLPPQEEVTLSDGKTYLVEERDGEKILKLKN